MFLIGLVFYSSYRQAIPGVPSLFVYLGYMHIFVSNSLDDASFFKPIDKNLEDDKYMYIVMFYVILFFSVNIVITTFLEEVQREGLTGITE